MQTKLNTYQEETHNFNTKRESVYNCIKAATAKYGNITDAEIKINTGYTINCVCGRRNELLKMGRITQDEARISRHWQTDHKHVSYKTT
jgi:hypothetical protein